MGRVFEIRNPPDHICDSGIDCHRPNMGRSNHHYHDSGKHAMIPKGVYSPRGNTVPPGEANPPGGGLAIDLPYPLH